MFISRKIQLYSYENESELTKNKDPETAITNEVHSKTEGEIVKKSENLVE